MNKKTKKKLIKFLIVLLVTITAYVYTNYETILENVFNSNNNQQELIQHKENISSNNNLEITYLDVGQADSTLIEYKDKNILIDAGNNGDGELLVDYFKSLNIDKFDYVIATHPHEDHIGGMDDIISNFKIDNFFAPAVEQSQKTYKDMINALKKNDVDLITPREDAEYKLDELNFKVLSIDNNKEEINNDSIVIKLNYLNNSFLFMGDLEKEKELEILDKDLNSDVLKVGHHGSKYSSSAQFLVKVKPKYAIISAGKNNKYNHPDNITIEKLEYLNTEIHQTKDEGSIKITSDGSNITINSLKTNTNKE